MAHRIVEMVIGRLITDEQFRSEFVRAPEQTLTALSERGLELSRVEMSALLTTDPSLWTAAAEALDVRLQKATLRIDANIPDAVWQRRDEDG